MKRHPYFVKESTKKLTLHKNIPKLQSKNQSKSKINDKVTEITTVRPSPTESRGKRTEFCDIPSTTVQYPIM